MVVFGWFFCDWLGRDDMGFCLVVVVWFDGRRGGYWLVFSGGGRREGGID
ncbi:MAG: hypothetical protein GX230_03020 [Lentisphaerae bacterium]|nr:hypothetical protein [Lentisphaerota bacterium]